MAQRNGSNVSSTQKMEKKLQNLIEIIKKYKFLKAYRFIKRCDDSN
jgi:hypothetical protein